VGIVLTLMELSLLGRLERGDPVGFGVLERNDRNQQIYAVVAVPVLVCAIIALFMWIHRTTRNAWALGIAGLKFTPGWSVIWWLIPIASLFQPYRIVSEVWRASAGELGSETWKTGPIPGWLPIWWLCFLGSGMAGSLCGRFYRTAQTIADFQVSDYLALTSGALALAAWPLLIKLVTEVQARQETLTARVEAVGSAAD